jgi:hypothetical protein
MSRKTSSKLTTPLLPLALCLCCLPAAAQQPAATDKPAVPAPNAPAATTNEKAEQVLARAVAALGGDAYLAIRSTIGRGLFTPIVKGIAEPPRAFVDYLVFPDRERTEFRGGGNRIIETYNGTTGWLFDDAARSLKDQPPASIENFRLSLRTSLDNLLRGWWRKEGATLTYVGRHEAGLGRRNEAVRLTYPDGFTVDFEVGAKDGLPAKTLYKRKNAAGEEVQEEDRYGRYLTINGVTLPYVIDHYRAGDPTSRISFDAIEFNRPIADSLFDRPANFKAVK